MNRDADRLLAELDERQAEAIRLRAALDEIETIASGRHYGEPRVALMRIEEIASKAMDGVA